jgi:hypothetical protein
MSPAMHSHLYQNPENPNEIIDSPFGKMEAWRANSMMNGTLSGFQE